MKYRKTLFLGLIILCFATMIIPNINGYVSRTPYYEIDDTDPEFMILKGHWNSRNHPNAFGGSTKWNPIGTGNNRAGWRVDTVVDPGEYEVYVWKFEHQFLHLMATNTPYKVKDRTGTISPFIRVDQSTPGNEWIYLGNFEFDNGIPQGIGIFDNADGYVAADAVRLVYAGTLS